MTLFEEKVRAKLARLRMATRSQLAICGYIRKNFDDRCWIDEIIAIIIQLCHNVIESGSLIVFGDGYYGELGLEKYGSGRNHKCITPTLCPPFDQNNVFDISAGWNQTFIVDVDGDVWRCGMPYGYTPRQAEQEGTLLVTPKKMKLKKPVLSISSGHRHTLFLLQNRTVQSMGYNSNGQLGHGDREKCLAPKTIKKLKKYRIVQISAGGQHSAALTENGELFWFGGNEFYDECSGYSEGARKGKRKCIMTPTMIDMDDEIAFVDCGYEHTLLITCQGLLYSFGNGSRGRLGHRHKTDKWEPTLIESLKGINIVTCSAGEEHSLCVDEDGFVYGFGNNRGGRCAIPPPVGNKTCHTRRTPRKIEWFVENKIKAKECIAGNENSAVISTDGDLYLFGHDNTEYYISHYYRNPWIPHKKRLPENMRAKKVSIASRHSLVICEKNIDCESTHQ